MSTHAKCCSLRERYLEEENYRNKKFQNKKLTDPYLITGKVKFALKVIFTSIDHQRLDLHKSLGVKRTGLI